MKKVSVIIATYRRENELINAINSVLNQTYGNIEIILVDDNSDSYWNSKINDIVLTLRNGIEIVYIQNLENKGSAESRNVGIRASHGEYVTFLDDDDEYLPEKIEHQVMAMEMSGADYSITDIALYDEDDHLIETRSREYIRSYDRNSLIKYHILHHITGTDAMMFTRSYFDMIGGFGSKDIGDEFYLMMNAIEGGGKFLYIDCCDIKALIHNEGGGLSTGSKKVAGECELYKFKKQYFMYLSFYERRFLRTRHYAVLAYFYLRQKKIVNFIRYSILGVLCSPVSMISIILRR